MRSSLKVLALCYVGLALLGRYKESQGRLVCGCDDTCWCKSPGVSLFRWVFPFGHDV